MPSVLRAGYSILLRYDLSKITLLSLSISGLRGIWWFCINVTPNVLNCSHLLFLWVRMFRPPSLTHHGSSSFKRKLFLLKYEARSSILKFWTNKYFLKPLSTGTWRNRWNAWCSCGRASAVLEQGFRLRLSQVGLKSCQVLETITMRLIWTNQRTNQNIFTLFAHKLDKMSNATSF